MKVISTGCRALDSILDGGIRLYTLTNVFGESATGKSQFAFQLCVNFAVLDEEVLFIDALNNFRPERLLEMKCYNGTNKNVLDRIYVYRPRGIKDALDMIEKIELDNLRIIIIDDISELLLDSGWRNIIKDLIIFIRKLSLKAIKYDLAVLITNRVTFAGYQKFDNIINRYVHYKIRFSKTNTLFSADMLHPVEATAYFRISRKGLEDIYL